MNPIIQQILDSPCGPLNQHLRQENAVNGNKEANKGIIIPKPNKTKQYIHQVLQAWADANGLLLVTELVFDKLNHRKWRFDWAILKEVSVADITAGEWQSCNQVLAIEFEGIFGAKSRHTTVGGYLEDSIKYTQAALQGWTVLRYTANNYKSLPGDLAKIKL